MRLRKILQTTYGKLTPIEHIEGTYNFRARCECGSIAIYKFYDLRSHRRTECADCKLRSRLRRAYHIDLSLLADLSPEEQKRVKSTWRNHVLTCYRLGSLPTSWARFVADLLADTNWRQDDEIELMPYERRSFNQYHQPLYVMR